MAPGIAGTGINVEYHDVLVWAQPGLDHVVGGGQARLPGTNDHDIQSTHENSMSLTSGATLVPQSSMLVMIFSWDSGPALTLRSNRAAPGDVRPAVVVLVGLHREIPGLPTWQPRDRLYPSVQSIRVLTTSITITTE